MLSASRSLATCRLRCPLRRQVKNGVVVAKAMVKEDLMLGLSGDVTPTTSDRLLVNEYLPRLEGNNPTATPAYSDSIQGEWEMLYSGSVSPGVVPSPTREIALAMYAGGFSPASFVYQVANRLPKEFVQTSPIKLKILPENPKAEVTVDFTVFNRTQPVVLRNTLDVESECRLREKYVEAEVMGQAAAVPEALRYERLIFVTYLDDELLVVRDESGSPDIFKRLSPPPTSEPPIADQVQVMEPEVTVEVAEPEIVA